MCALIWLLEPWLHSTYLLNTLAYLQDTVPFLLTLYNSVWRLFRAKEILCMCYPFCLQLCSQWVHVVNKMFVTTKRGIEVWTLWAYSLDTWWLHFAGQEDLLAYWTVNRSVFGYGEFCAGPDSEHQGWKTEGMTPWVSCLDNIILCCFLNCHLLVLSDDN